MNCSTGMPSSGSREFHARHRAFKLGDSKSLALPRERAKKGISSSRQPSVQKTINDAPKSQTQISLARVSDVKKLSVSDLHERYTERDVDQAWPTHDQLGPIDDVWEDEQLRKLGINLNRPATIRDGGDPFAEVRSRIEERLRRLKGELELSLESKENT